ncbi:class I SAM-dependent methyltransferase [Streptomyces sp. NPDC004726]
MSNAPMTAAEYWDKYKPYKGEGSQPPPRTDRFDWTQYPGHGPGAEFLGSPTRALELGPAEGKEAAHLAHWGVQVTAVDFSAEQVGRALGWWRDAPRLTFVHAEACAFLNACPDAYDAIYSVWGAVWFTDPEELFPQVAKRLTPGGVFAFSHAEPGPGAYGPQRMGGTWLEGREKDLTVLRWQYAPEMWADLLKRHGFARVEARVLAAPGAEALGTLMVRAWVTAP